MGQAIYMGKDMPNTLICPNQLRRNGITIDECPKHLAPINKLSTHSIICPDNNLETPLSLQGLILSLAHQLFMMHGKSSV
jgi:hypothetical protein